MNRFMITFNPQRRGRIFISHTIKPKCQIEVVKVNDKIESPPKELHQTCFYKTENSTEKYTLILRDQFDDAEDETIEKLFKKAWFWYRSCLEGEETKEIMKQIKPQ